MATQVQNRRGTTAEHSTFTGANGELTVDTTKRTLVVHDGATAGGRPLLREDQSNLPTSAPTTGIYNASGSLAISTGGSGRLFVDASGNVGVGTDSLSRNFTVRSASTIVAASLVSNPANIAYLLFGDTDADAQGRVQYNNSTDSLELYSAGSERLRITSAGLVGVGTSSPDSTLHIATTASSTVPGFRLSSSGSLANNDIFRVQINGLTNGFRVFQDASSNVRYTFEGGSVGIGTTSPAVALEVSTTSPIIRSTHSTTGDYLQLFHNGSGAYLDYSADDLIIRSASSTERARIDSSGRLVVGTSSSSTGLEGQYAKLQVIGNSSGAGGGAYFTLGKDEAATGITADEMIARITFGNTGPAEFAYISCQADGTAGSGDYPGRLVFSTTADGASSPTERMRLINSGFLKVSNDGSYQSTTSGNHEFTNTLDSDSLVVRSTNASYSGNGILALATRNTTNNSFYAFSYYNSGASAYRFRIADSGNATNTNNSYGAISDAKLKENIVDATSQWSDIKALQVRKYNFKKETGQQTHTQIGLIAQEVELVSPGLVSESPDRDAEGNDLGTVTKSVNYSVLYMKAVKALQEAMERIETLEAKVAALESA